MNHLFPHPRDDIILSQTISFLHLGKKITSNLITKCFGQIGIPNLHSC